MKILVVKLSAVGDVVMSLPFLSVLRKAFPGAVIGWVVEEAAADILIGHPDLDQVIVSRRKRWQRDLAKAGLGRAWNGAAGFVRELRAGHWDLAVDLQGLFKSGIVTFLSGAPRRIGFDRSRELSSAFVNERLAPYDPDRHALERYLDVASWVAGGRADRADFFLPEDPEAGQEARRLTAFLDGPFVVVNPGAKWLTKLWPIDHWQRLCRKLKERTGRTVVLTGSPDEVPMNRTIARTCPDLADLTGQTGLRVLGEIMRRADLVISPDTGPMHLAAAVRTPVTALFGPTAPWRTGPHGPGHLVIRKNLACSPCFRKSCPSPVCMTGITADEVLDAVAERLGV